jgi:two-component system sensor histidine kinase PilS (NtrC family)
MTSLQGIQGLRSLGARDAARADLVYDRQLMWLRYLGVARIGVLSVLAVGAAFLELERGQSTLLACYVVGFVSSLWSLHATQRQDRRGILLCWTQLLIDFAIVAVTVAYTHGATSLFTFMFVVVVLEAGLLLGLSQSFVIATLASAFMAAQILLPVTTGRSLSWFEPVYNLLIQSLAFFLAAFVSGYWNQRIHRLQEFQRDILDNMNSGFLITDARGTITVLNEAACALLGVAPEAATGRHISSVLRVAKGGECPIITALRSRQDFLSYEFKAIGGTAGEEVLLGLTTNCMRDAKGSITGVIASFTDLTEMDAMREELRRQDRLAVVGELAAGLAHEIRNPVAVIRGALEELGRGEPSAALDAKLRTMAIRESDHLNEIVSGFLSFAREPSRKREVIDVRTMAEETAELVRREYAEHPGTIVHVSCPDSPRRVSCDPSQIKQVFVNLAKNAVEAMDMKGALEISVNTGPGPVEIRFDDTGPGIDPDKIGRIFEPFFTTKESGVGMGLAVCIRIVTAHDGTIRASARKGGGCSMRVSLPSTGQGREQSS